MRSLVALVLVLATAGVLVTSALAADPEPEKLGFSGTFTDPDFCGTGRARVHRQQLPRDALQCAEPVRLRVLAHDPGTRTSSRISLTGQQATVRSAGTQRWWFVHDGDPATPPLSVTLDTGLRAQLVAPGAGGLRTRDAGYVVLQFTFTIFDGQVVVEHGPHPQLAGLLEAGSDTFCAMMTERSTSEAQAKSRVGESGKTWDPVS